MADPEFPASLADLPEPGLPGRHGRASKSRPGGICGSDLHLFAHNTGPSPTLASIGTFPFVLGHETAGRVVEAGANCSVAVGTRVVIDPCIPCLPRGIDPPCANCARGWTSSCLNLDSRIVSSGRSLGYTMDLGGGWADSVLAHDSMLHPLPDAIEDRGASLYEPVSIACHGLLRADAGRRRARPDRGRGDHRVGVPRRAPRAVPGLSGHGAGPPPAPGRGRGQACGADHVVLSDPDNGHWEELAALSDSRVVGRKRHQMLMGGFPYVIEAVGSPGRSPRRSAPSRTGAACCCWARPASARSTSRRSGTRRRRSSVPSTTQSTRTRRRDWRAVRTGTRSTARSTCSPPDCCHTGGRDARVRARGVPGSHRSGARPATSSQAIKVVFRP